MDSGFSMGPVYKSAALAVLIIIFLLVQNSFDSRTTVVFCDVGQGDGAYIRVKNQIDIVIDAGSGQQILDCLGKYMPFYDRTIEFAFNTHPQNDHYGGFNPIIERYKVERFFLSPVDNLAKSFTMLQQTALSKDTEVKPFYRGQTINFGEVSIRALWPTKEYVIQSDTHIDEDKDGYYETKKDLNDFSQVVLLKIGQTKILFTGDLTPLAGQLVINGGQLPIVSILKVPHHGSKNGLVENFLEIVKPKVAIISNGKKNRFGHPSPQIIKMLEKHNIPIRRTDSEGNIVYKF